MRINPGDRCKRQMEMRFRIGRKGFCGVSLSLEERLNHLIIAPASDQSARAILTRLLEHDASQLCSAIVFSSDVQMASRGAALWRRSGRQVIRVDPLASDAYSVNPLFEEGPEIIPRIVSALAGREHGHSEEARFLADFLRAIRGKYPGTASLPLAYRLLREDSHFLRRSGVLDFAHSLHPEHIERLLLITAVWLSIFAQEQIASSFLRSEVFVPIYYHEPTFLWVRQDPGFPQLSDLVFQLILHQILSYPRTGPLPFSVYLEGLPLPDLKELRGLTAKRVAMHYLASEIDASDIDRVGRILKVGGSKAELISPGRSISAIRLPIPDE